MPNSIKPTRLGNMEGSKAKRIQAKQAKGVSKKIFSRIIRANTSKEAWEILKNEFKGSNKIIFIRLQSLRKDFDTLLIKEDKPIKHSSLVSQILSIKLKPMRHDRR